MDTMRGGGGGRHTAVAITVVAAILLILVDVLTAFDDDGLVNPRRRYGKVTNDKSESEMPSLSLLSR